MGDPTTTPADGRMLTASPVSTRELFLRPGHSILKSSNDERTAATLSWIQAGYNAVAA